MHGAFRSAVLAGAVVSVWIASTQIAFAQIVAAHALGHVTNPGDRAKLGDIAINDDEIVIPGLHDQYMMTVRAYAAGKDGGDQSTASMTLYVNDGRVAYRADSKFNTYNLDATYKMLTKPDTPVRVRFEHTNDRARETSAGLEIVDIERF